MTLVDALISKATQTRQPISGTFELTARCNLKCKMCYIHDENRDSLLTDRELSAEQWIAIADQASARGTLILLLTGGEPMLRSDFAKIYRACAERGFLLTVNTNGTLLTDEIFDLFTEHPPLRLNVSLYGFSDKTYRDLCGNDSAFLRTKNNILRLHDLGISMQINFSATPFNQHELPKVYDFAKSIGAQLQYTAYMFPPTRIACQAHFRRFTPEESGLATTQYLRLKRGSDDLAAYCANMLKKTPPRADDCGEIYDGVRCRAGRAAYWVTFDGNMLPCGMIPTLATPILSNGFTEAWQKTVEAFSKVKAPLGCLSCEHYDRCDVCPAICHAECGDFGTVPEYICEKNSTYRAALSKIVRETEELPCV